MSLRLNRTTSGIYLMFCLCIACGKQPDTLPLPTSICLRAQHHNAPIPHAEVRIKYNTDTFPGYNQPASYFDRTGTADQNARICLDAIPEGTHWLVGSGYDSLSFPHDVIGSMQIRIDLRTKPKVDTIFYLSE
jgi:hypothetical protein